MYMHTNISTKQFTLQQWSMIMPNVYVLYITSVNSVTRDHFKWPAPVTLSKPLAM